MDTDDRGTTRLLLAALVAGLVAAGVPAAWLLAQDGSRLVAGVIALLGLLPVALALLARDRPASPG